jgi:hypothetical protein
MKTYFKCPELIVLPVVERWEESDVERKEKE